MTRLQRLAPTLLLLLAERAISIGIAWDDQQLLLLEGLATTATRNCEPNFRHEPG